MPELGGDEYFVARDDRGRLEPVHAGRVVDENEIVKALEPTGVQALFQKMRVGHVGVAQARRGGDAMEAGHVGFPYRL